VSGYFNDLNAAWESIRVYERKYSIYFTLQELDERIIYRCLNKLKPYAKNLTKNSEVLRYKFLHIDADPVRPSGIQATNAEVHLGREKLLQCVSFLSTEMSFPEPIICFSGNGCTADYHVDLENTPENVSLCENALKALDILFSDENVTIDVSVSNPARIIKLPYSLSCKGSNTEERPYRRSELLQIPKEKTELRKTQLISLSNLYTDLSEGGQL
jgi:hypothetical protein